MGVSVPVRYVVHSFPLQRWQAPTSRFDRQDAREQHLSAVMITVIVQRGQASRAGKAVLDQAARANCRANLLPSWRANHHNVHPHGIAYLLEVNT